ncbi:MAG: hypothetical protein GY760_18775 [Deltaproteobacteria bacterium]|nr:hypothetical protein [Deltaproteobacteria bacterium]
MIITFVKESYDIVESALRDEMNHDFGVLFCYDKKFGAYPKADDDEDIYITAHGNDNEIGDERGFGLTAEKLAKELKTNFLGGYWNGRVYLSCCDSAPTFSRNLKQALGRGSVFGVIGGINYDIMFSGNPNWVRAI